MQNTAPQKTYSVHFEPYEKLLKAVKKENEVLKVRIKKNKRKSRDEIRELEHQIKTKEL